MRQTAHLRVVSDNRQTPQMGHMPPARQTNASRRDREHLSIDEVKLLIAAARQTRHGARDAAAIQVAFNHGLRVSELCALRWRDVRWDERVVYINRLKGSRSGEHPLTEEDMRALGRMGTRSKAKPSDHVFDYSAAGFRKMVSRLRLPPAIEALAPHPHVLRHSCGYHLGRLGQPAQVIARYLGHTNIEHVMRYVYVDATQFEGLMP
jgi:integrase